MGFFLIEVTPVKELCEFKNATINLRRFRCVSLGIRVFKGPT